MKQTTPDWIRTKKIIIIIYWLKTQNIYSLQLTNKIKPDMFEVRSDISDEPSSHLIESKYFLYTS